MFLFDNIRPMGVNNNHKPFNEIYLNRIGRVICNAMQEHPRTTIIRVDCTYRSAGMWATTLPVRLI